jgi:hypothetical protein
MSYLDIKSLVVSGDKKDADSFVVVARRLDYRLYDIETSATNILARLQDSSYQVCFLFETIVGRDGIARLVDRIRGNIQAKQVPLVIIGTEPIMELGEDYYALGIQFVMDKLTGDKLKEALLVTESWTAFCNQFKEGREKFFRR